MSISKSEKELIMAHLKLHLAESEWGNIDTFFNEAYYIELRGQKCIALCPELYDLGGAMVFSTLTGEFMDIMCVDDVKKQGTLI